MEKRCFFSVDLELLCDIDLLQPHLPAEPDYTPELHVILDLFEQYHIRATFFACVNYIEENPESIRLILDRGHDLGLHGLNHTAEILEDDDFISQLSAAKKRIEEQFNTVILGYRAPSFDIDQAEVENLAKCGFQFDSSYFIYSRALFKSQFSLHSLPLKEFAVWPHETYPLAGGAYCRMLPHFIFKRKIKKYLRRTNEYNFYLHPYDLSRQIVVKKAPIAIKYFLMQGTKKYLKRIVYIIKLLQAENFRFCTYREEL